MSDQGDFKQTVTVNGVEYCVISGTGNASIIINYFYDSFNFPKNDNHENLPCPYRGLLHFSYKDAQFFFGREIFVEELFRVIQTCNFIPIIGASGSGKSSVVFAGLVPRLQQEHWIITHFRPGSDPFYSLAVALISPDKADNLNLSQNTQDYQARKLAGQFRSKEVTFPEIISCIQEQNPNKRILIIADQFEELYTLSKDYETCRTFLDFLLGINPSSANQLPSSTVLVATMRADFLDKALLHRSFANVLKNDIKLGAMNREELKQVIERPAQKLKVTFEHGLVKRIVDDLEKEPGNLPLLEFALTLLWQRRTGEQLTHTAYQDIGEVQGALARYADEKYRQLNNYDEQEQVKRIFIQLIRLGQDTGDTRRLATREEFDKVSWKMVKKLADDRLVVTSRNAAGQETVEIVHEALIRHWQVLRSYIEQNRAKLIQKDRFERLAKEWEDKKKSKDYLLQGKQLNEAQVFQQQETSNFRLSPLACDFIKQSIERRRNNRFKVFGLGLVLPLGLTIYIGNVLAKEFRITQLRDIIDKEGNNLIDSTARRKALEELVKLGASVGQFNFSNGNLSTLELSNADLSGATFAVANFRQAILKGANFSRTHIVNANFSNANLSGAKFIDASLSTSVFNSADLSGADFTNAHCSSTNFSGANLTKANFSKVGYLRPYFTGANIKFTDFRNPNLNADLLVYVLAIQGAKNWQYACYNPDVRKKLGLPPENPSECDK
ncbi:MAG: pentapeptide repeat-containing protein [Nodularia sp. (in: Bacteria)]|nr:MAG: pentapeptide repeat-containing protein [Nodularia sp. (in: cyanobacteria)]